MTYGHSCTPTIRCHIKRDIPDDWGFRSQRIRFDAPPVIRPEGLETIPSQFQNCEV